MRENEVYQKHFCERPVLFLVEIVDENILYFLHFIQALPDFQNHTESNIFGDDKFCVYIHNQYGQAKNINEKFSFDVIYENLLECWNFAPIYSFDAQKIDNYFYSVEAHWECL